jgi:EpsI family protein
MSPVARMTLPAVAKHCAVLAMVVAVALVTLFSGETRATAAKGADLSSLPLAVGNWKAVGNDGAAASKESTFLNDVLYRTYRRDDGKTLVLAVAYGADQRKKFNLHLPERCYAASGYQVLSLAERAMHSPELKLKEMMVQDQASTQQVQYWIVLGGKQITSELEKRARHLYYSVMGVSAEGVLVRVSSFSSDREAAGERQVQQDFIAALYKTASQGQRKLLFGSNA